MEEIKPIYIRNGMISLQERERLEKLSKRPVCLVCDDPNKHVYDPCGIPGCNCLGQIRPVEPSKCEHEWLEVSIGYRCMNCGVDKPSDSGGEKEVEELASIISKSNISVGLNYKRNELAAKAILDAGYSKQPKSNELVALDRIELHAIAFTCWCESEEKFNAVKFIETILSKFGKPKMLSVEEIEKILNNFTFDSKHSGMATTPTIIAQVIQDAMVKEN